MPVNTVLVLIGIVSLCIAGLAAISARPDGIGIVSAGVIILFLWMVLSMHKTEQGGD